MKYEPKRTLCFGDSANKLVAKWWAEAGGRPPKVTSKTPAIPKDDASRVQVGVYSLLNDFGAGDFGILDNGTKSRIDAVLDGYPEKEIGPSDSDMRRLPIETQHIVESMIHDCAPDFVNQSVSQQDLVRSEALVAEHVANWQQAKVYWAKKQQTESERQAADRAFLKREEDIAIGKWRDCLTANVTGLAVVSTEPAEVVVRAAYAACRPQREATMEIYNKQRADPGAGERIMNEIEHGVMDHFILTVIQARAAHAKPPPAPTSQPTQNENPI